MPRSKEISDEVRRRVVEAHEAGKGYKTISKVCALHRSTVRQIIYKWKTFNTVSSRPRSGRPTKMATVLCKVRRRGADPAPDCAVGVEDEASVTLVLPDVPALTEKTTKRIRRKEKTKNLEPKCNHDLGSHPSPAERHTEVMLCCEICGTCFTTETDLESHQAQHLEKTLHECEECGRAFQSTASLRAHRKRKHGC